MTTPDQTPPTPPPPKILGACRIVLPLQIVIDQDQPGSIKLLVGDAELLPDPPPQSTGTPSQPTCDLTPQ